MNATTLASNKNLFCAYVPGNDSITTIIKNGKCIYSGETTAQLNQKYPNIIVMLLDNALKEIDLVLATQYNKVSQTTEDNWDYMLSVLPPVDWYNNNETESFKISENTEADYTQIFCRIGELYYSFIGKTYLTHDAIVNFVQQNIANNTVKQGVHDE